MRRLTLKMPNAVPCKYCGSQPETRSVDVHFKPSDDYLTTEIQIRCSNGECDKRWREHRHFRPTATRREAVLRWNKVNVAKPRV